MIRFKFIEKIPVVFRNKYLLTIVIFVDLAFALRLK